METNAKYIDELELMRQDMNQLRSLLSGQQIVNERLMRRAMNKEISKERRSIFVTIGCAIVGTFVFYSMQPVWHLPIWFILLTIAFFITCVVATVWSIRRLMKESLLTGDLLVVAKRINDYKRLSINWLKFGIPFVLFWIVGFVYYASRDMNPDVRFGFFGGAATGLVIGSVFGIWHLVDSHRRLNGILKQINEIKTGE